jgi:putative holliday junction resolvase
MSRFLGVDYGERRVGLAVSDPTGIIATPLRTAEVTSDREAVRAVCEAADETEAVRIVVGDPVNMNGTRGMMCERVAAFVELLQQATDVPVVLYDERLSSGLVERAMLEADLSRQKRKRARDKLAAQVILQGYVDAQASGLELPFDPE